MQVNVADLLANLKHKDQDFIAFLLEKDESLSARLQLTRKADGALPRALEWSSEELITLSIHLESFLLTIFPIKEKYQADVSAYLQRNVIFAIRQRFIQRRVLKKHNKFCASKEDIDRLHHAHHVASFNDYEFAIMVKQAQENEDELTLQSYETYASWALFSVEGKFLYRNSFLFNPPLKDNKYQQLLVDGLSNTVRNDLNAISIRKDFASLGSTISNDKLLGEAKYCLYCHKRQKDSCRKGMKVINNNGEDRLLSGCPLDQKISEMNILLAHGHILAALAIVMIDNPLAIATGHRICNDCSKACIFQNQDPVDIPAIESGMIEFILSLPWGFEIYSLLTRWNPLKANNFLTLPPNGKRVIVAGMGPAGFSMAYFLLQHGYTVLAVDGLAHGSSIGEIANNTIYDYYSDISEDKYRADGFGGVMEYGITVRWNKHYLRGIRLLLERYDLFKLLPGVHWGRTITDREAFEKFKFDAVALALGSGSIKLPDLDHLMAPGMLLASDFLMHLHLVKLKNHDFHRGIQLNWPVVVIGGGLTAIDVSTEIMPYYIRQVQALRQHYGEQLGKGTLSAELEQCLQHCEIFERHNYRHKAVLDALGTVKMLIKRSVSQSRSWQQNRQEVMYALQAGVEIVENFDPKQIVLDKDGRVSAVVSGAGYTLPARTIVLATGTESNISFVRASAMVTLSDGRVKLSDEIMAHNAEQKPIFILGDMNPKYSGSVVQAIASAKRGIVNIDNIMLSMRSDNDVSLKRECSFLQDVAVALQIKIAKYQQYDFGALLSLGSEFIAQKTAIGHIFKMRFFDQSVMHSMPVTVVGVEPDLGLIRVFLLGAAAKKVCALIASGDAKNIDFMGPLGESCLVSSNKRLLIITQSRGFYYAKAIMQHNAALSDSIGIVDDVDGHLEGYHNDSKDWHLIGQDFDKNLIDILQRAPEKFDECVFLGKMKWACLIYRHIHDIWQLQGCNFVYQVETSMQCMLNGVCGRCLIGNRVDGYIFTCGHQEVCNLHQIMAS